MGSGYRNASTASLPGRKRLMCGFDLRAEAARNLANLLTCRLSASAGKLLRWPGNELQGSNAAGSSGEQCSGLVTRRLAA